MSSVLFQAGKRRPPRTALRRIVWGVVTLVPLGVIAAFVTIGAVQGWTGEAAMTAADRTLLTAFAVVLDVAFVLIFAVGAIRVREQLAPQPERSEDAAE